MSRSFFEDHNFNITTIDTGFLRPKFAASHLIIENQHAAFVDVGTSHAVPRLLNVLKQKNIPVENVDYVIVTHVHLDHAGAAGALMQALPNAKLVVHSRGARHMIDPSKLIAGSLAVYGEEKFKAYFGEIIPTAEESVIIAEDGLTLDLQGRTLTFIDTPGHARHHGCLFDAQSQSFFTGDAFGISYRDFDSENGIFIFPATTPVQFEPEVMHESIDKLMHYQPQAMFLTHYGKVDNVAILAGHLHKGIDKLVDIMHNLSQTQNQRHHIIFQAIMNAFLSELEILDCSLSIERCRELLAPDVELNAQGLAVWWDKRQTKA